MTAMLFSRPNFFGDLRLSSFLESFRVRMKAYQPLTRRFYAVQIAMEMSLLSVTLTLCRLKDSKS